MKITDKKYSVSSRNLNEIEDSVLTASEKEAARFEASVNRKLMSYIWIASLIILCILGGRIFYLNVVKGSYYLAAAQDNSIRSLSITAPRGKIMDRSGKILVSNVPSIDVVADRSLLPKDQTERELTLSRVASFFGIELEVIKKELDAAQEVDQNRVVLRQSITQDEALRFAERENEFEGIQLERRATRQYEESAIFAHIIGYEGKVTAKDLQDNPNYLLTDSIGRQGVERSYESELRGEHGAKRVEVDSLGRVKRQISTIQPVPGNDLVLSINYELQKKIHDTLSSELEQSDIERGAAIALDPRNGEVLALVSLPSYDNNIFAHGVTGEQYRFLISNENRPLFNRAIGGEYPPGSTIKPIIAAAALQEGIIGKDVEIESRGGIAVGDFYFGDWKAHGFTDIERAIAVSSDVYFYSIGGGYGGVPGLGMERMKQYEELFGYNAPSGIDLPSEATGFVPDEEWKKREIGERWYIGNTYHASIGQGYITTTPLQVANSIAAIANGGTLYEPRVVSQIRQPDGDTRSNSPEVIRKDFVSKSVLEIVRSGMRKTVTEGTAQQLKELPVAVAGKTGTAQFGSEDKTHGWFVSFAPYENPEIVLVVLVEGQGEDTYNTVPVTKEVYEWYFAKDGAEFEETVIEEG